ncbi:DUF4166 domain-containing protein [Lysobacter humi (ex Lee et al. 2017)]
MTTIFARLLGGEFRTLPPTVQRLHLREGRARYHGEVVVERGAGLLSRLCAAATRLPPPGSGPIVVDLDITPGREMWTRRVAGRAMPSRLVAHGGRLRERLGLVTFDFDLAVRDGCIEWRVARAAALGLALPLRWFDGVRATESEADGRYRFDVRARLPVVGRLVHYRGWLDVD